MYPGREFASFVLTSDYCGYNRSIPCDATKAGLYNTAQSQLGGSGSDGFIQWRSGPDYMLGLQVKGPDLTSWIDYMEIGGQSVPNVSMALLGENFAEYPDGSWKPLSVGCLGIGAPDTVNQSFSNDFGPMVNASLIPGYLWSQGTTASNSFGMHIGSVVPPVDGSLYFGGYDQNRIIGDIITETDDYTKEITLKDITINVVEGASPWKFESMSGILAQGNDSISSAGIQVSVDGCSPYLSLPRSTCDALASYLPVDYNEDLGLYIWKTNDKKYAQIIGSPSALQFTFLSGSNTQNVTISVPFLHLNLTLDAPLVEEPQQYLPCFTGSDRYTLGRAFLQDAFVGANWGAKTWWLAQAPGPSVPSSRIVELQEGDTSITASNNDWKASWSGTWKALSAEEVSGAETGTVNGTANQPSTPENTADTDTDPPQSGLASGAMAGIGIGAGLGALAIFGGLWFFFIRRRNRASKGDTEGSAASVSGGNVPSHGWYQPVKASDATSPGMQAPSEYGSGTQSTNGMFLSQQYQQQPYPQLQHQQPYYAQELTAVGNTPPMELPGSNPENYEPQLLGVHAAPQNFAQGPTPGYGADQETTYASGQSQTRGYHGPASESSGTNRL
ncbi:hypothetical protein DL765_004149 [Monosporascus sp. GIB2]|nr:hypothetical protein DL765_004149 [Monosporascus sp. GIB2]